MTFDREQSMKTNFKSLTKEQLKSIYLNRKRNLHNHKSKLEVIENPFVRADVFGLISASNPLFVKKNLFQCLLVHMALLHTNKSLSKFSVFRSNLSVTTICN